MGWYYYIAIFAIFSQLFFLLQISKNFRYALSKYKRKRTWYRPKTVLIVPCKGIDSNFKKNIASFFEQDYESYVLCFVVAEVSDPAYAELCNLKEQFSQSSQAKDVQILVAGHGESCSQKVHNLLYCYKQISNDIEVMAFADSDVCVQSNWLSHIVYPLHAVKNGAASGYRWFIPKRNNAATLALSAVNAKIAQLLGNTRFNQVWGGSMAIRVNVFREIGLEEIWQKALSDDLSLSYAVKKTGKKVAFVPACLAASYESTSWPELFEFGRRQFLITRISAPRTWRFGLYSSIYSILGLWAGTVLAVYAAQINAEHMGLFITVPVIFFGAQLTRAIFRQIMISRLLEEDWPKMKVACVVDIVFFWAFTWLMLIFIVASAFGRTITWRGIRYKMLSPTEIIVISR